MIAQIMKATGQKCRLPVAVMGGTFGAMGLLLDASAREYFWYGTMMGGMCVLILVEQTIAAVKKRSSHKP